MSRIPVGTHTTRARRTRRAFTLAEMLVVVGITALLISIVLPSLNAARKHAERVTCAANLRSVGQAYHIYANEYKGEYAPQSPHVLPNGYWGSPVSGPGGAPDGPAIVFQMGHLPDPRILYCASADAEATDNDTAAGYEQGREGGRQVTNLNFWDRAKRTNLFVDGNLANQTGYAFWTNQDLRFSRDDRRRDWFARFKDDPADRVMASDHMTRGDTGDRWTGHKVDSRRRRVTTAPLPGFPADPDPDVTVNFEGGNVLYNDGHVEWKSTNETVWRFADPDDDYDVFW
jgi:prepilin-type N-terminal cleavage/methylation domain-containing protein/prepilin-type processing-associated H-X9-DG protein